MTLVKVTFKTGKQAKVLSKEVPALKRAGLLKEEKSAGVTKEEKSAGETKEVRPTEAKPKKRPANISSGSVKGGRPKKT